MNTIQLKLPYLIFIGDVQDPTLAKTGAGLAQWCREDVVGQLRLPGCPINLGVEDLSIELAVAAGAKSLVIGVATIGGSIQPHWIPIFVEALEHGLDIVNGLHTDLTKIPELADAQARCSGNIINIRKGPANLPVGNGSKRAGKRLLTVGTDCAVGKKYTALAMAKALNEQGTSATFRATGQTGIMIAGAGIPMDSVISDFLCGAAESISPANDAAHWDVIEGQGSLFNPSFSGVSMGLLHGSQPDAIIVCHDVARTTLSTCPDYGLPDIPDCIALHLTCARLVNPDVQCVGVSVNTSSLSDAESKTYLAELAERTGLPCIDPIRHGCKPIVQWMAQYAVL